MGTVEVSWGWLVTSEQRSIGEVALTSDAPDPRALAALGALGRVARALVGTGSLGHLAERALDEMREALALDVVVLYLPRLDRPSLQRFITSAGESAGFRPRDDVAFDDEAWGLAVASGAPIVFREEASWLVSNPFLPAAQSWLVLPLVSERRLVGVVVAAAGAPLSLDPTAATVLTLLGDLLADLALATRELALLESAPPPELARASAERLREAVASARRVVRSRLEDLSAHVPLGGLRAAVEEVSARRGQGLPLTVCCEGPAVDVSPETTAVVVRVLTEALTNSARHAHPDRVEVRLLVDDERLTLGIEDDGVGFQPSDVGGPGDGHFGLTLMRERARSAGGRLEIRSAPDEGTRVTLEMPV